MKTGLVVACAMAVPLLTFAGQGACAQDVWPPDDETPPPQSQAYSQAGTELGYGQRYPQQGGVSGGYQQPGYTQPGYAQQPMSPEQLDQLVAPIALYPDTLLAQILTASTYPAQISSAEEWLRSMGNAPPEQVAAGASRQTAWDPSIKALTAFPRVLEMLSTNLQWTSTLGNAYYNQPQDVLQTVQVLRQRAEQAGNLETTPQQQVVDNPGYISVAPANPQVVYVPAYNPWGVYGAPVSAYPGYWAGDSWGAYGGAGVEFGLGFAVGAFLGWPFGWSSWGFDWLGGGILFDHQCYWPHGYGMRDWGFEHGGPRYAGWYQHGGWRGGGGSGHQWARFGDYHNQPIQVHLGQGGFGQGGINRGGNSPVARAGGGNGPQNGFNRDGFSRGGFLPARPGGGNGPARLGGGGFGEQNGLNRGPQQGFNRVPSMPVRSQPVSGGTMQGYPRGPEVSRGQAGQPSYGGPRPVYGGSAQSGLGYVGRQGGGYGMPRYSAPSQGYGAPAPRYSAPSQGYRPPTQNFGAQNFGHGGYSRGPSQVYPGGYGGGHGGSSSHSSPYSGSFGGGGRAPSFSGGGHSGGYLSYGGGHAPSFGGGHSGGFSGGSHGGGGGSSGGGHSSGGSSHGRH